MLLRILSKKVKMAYRFSVSRIQSLVVEVKGLTKDVLFRKFHTRSITFTCRSCGKRIVIERLDCVDTDKMKLKEPFLEVLCPKCGVEQNDYKVVLWQQGPLDVFNMN